MKATIQVTNFQLRQGAIASAILRDTLRRLQHWLIFLLQITRYQRYHLCQGLGPDGLSGQIS